MLKALPVPPVLSYVTQDSIFDMNATMESLKQTFAPHDQLDVLEKLEAPELMAL